MRKVAFFLTFVLIEIEQVSQEVVGFSLTQHSRNFVLFNLIKEFLGFATIIPSKIRKM